MSNANQPRILVRPTESGDFQQMIEICQRVYPQSPAYGHDQLAKHRELFGQGQLVAIDSVSGQVAGFALSLIVRWDDYDMQTNWLTITDRGWFTNHDPAGMTLYGAEVMVHPDMQRRGVGKALYAARRDLCRQLKLKRIRAGARLRGYARYARQMTPQQYVQQVVAGQIVDPTLTFQLKQRFRVLAVVEHYLSHDPESQGHAAIIEWLNHDVVRRSDWKQRDTQWTRPPRARGGADPSGAQLNRRPATT